MVVDIPVIAKNASVQQMLMRKRLLRQMLMKPTRKSPIKLEQSGVRIVWLGTQLFSLVILTRIDTMSNLIQLLRSQIGILKAVCYLVPLLSQMQAPDHPLHLIPGISSQLPAQIPKKHYPTSRSSYLESVTLHRSMTPNLLNTPSAPQTSQLLRQFGSGLSSRNLHDASKILKAARASYTITLSRYLQICSEPTAYASLIKIQSREEVMWKLRVKIYQEFLSRQVDQKDYMQPFDKTLTEPQPKDVNRAEELLYASFYEFWQLTKAHIRKIKKDFVIPVLPQRSMISEAECAYKENSHSGNKILKIFEEQELERSQWKQEAVRVGDKTIIWIEKYWFCPETDHSESPELNMDGQELSENLSSNEFSPTFPLWQRKRVEFMMRIYTERRGHILRWLQENGIIATQVNINVSSLLYAIIYYEREKISQILQCHTARVNSCRLATERPEASSDIQAPMTNEIYEQLQAIWETLYKLLDIWDTFLQIYHTVQGKKEITEPNN